MKPFDLGYIEKTETGWALFWKYYGSGVNRAEFTYHWQAKLLKWLIMQANRKEWKLQSRDSGN